MKKSLTIILAIIIIGVLISSLSNFLVIKYYNKQNKIDAEINITSFELLAFFIEKLNLNIKITMLGENLDNSYSFKRKIIFFI